MHLFKKSILMKFFITVILLSSTDAHAEDKTLFLKTIEVTAEKKRANAQEVAIPMTTLGSVDIEDRSIKDMSDITLFSPNLQYSRNGRMDGGSFSYRGLGMGGMNVFTERSPLIVNIDGIPWGSRFGLGIDFSNVERIEFLRGPQGTLYGKNSMAGVINIITKEPDNSTSGKVKFFTEEYDTYGFNTQLSTPVVKDKFFVFLSAAYEKTDGWFKNDKEGSEKDWNNEENKTLFVKTVYKTNSRLKTTLQYRYDEVDAGNTPYIVGTKEVSYSAELNFKDPSFTRKTHDTALRVNYASPIADITSVTTYRTTTGKSKQFQSLSQYGGFDDADENSFTQELRFASKDEKKNSFSWITGLFYSKESMERKHMGITMDYSSIGLDVLSDDWPVTIDTDSYSVFGEATMPLFLRELTLTLGGRYEHVSREMDYKHEQYNYFTGENVGYSNTYMKNMPVAYDIDGSWNATLGKAAVKYKVNGNFMLYTSVTQGYMPGGFNYTMDVKEYAKFEEQKSMNYELGFKSNLLNKKLMFNANLFYTKYDDLQVYEKMSSTQFSVSNAGEAHAQGVEIDFNSVPAEGLNIYGSLGIMEAKYGDYKENSGSGENDYSDNYMIEAPKYTVSLSFSYRHAIGLFASADYHRVGETHFSKKNEEAYRRDTYNLVNAKVGYETEMGLDIYLYARNLLDKKYFTGAIDIYKMYEVAEPRTYGIEVSYRF